MRARPGAAERWRWRRLRADRRGRPRLHPAGRQQPRPGRRGGRPAPRRARRRGLRRPAEAPAPASSSTPRRRRCRWRAGCRRATRRARRRTRGTSCRSTTRAPATPWCRRPSRSGWARAASRASAKRSAGSTSSTPPTSGRWEAAGSPPPWAFDPSEHHVTTDGAGRPTKDFPGRTFRGRHEFTYLARVPAADRPRSTAPHGRTPAPGRLAGRPVAGHLGEGRRDGRTAARNPPRTAHLAGPARRRLRRPRRNPRRRDRTGGDRRRRAQGGRDRLDQGSRLRPPLHLRPRHRHGPRRRAK